ncbi:hypothetical protein [Microbacterium sediminis]|uniref:Uncharacterized protein n=1 Tax=Microbacterium sediminis TaxID=904291 RepID=A0A1B9NG38_9MICO|nr:hypothetical protein [Microbacterium sediminis]OCG75562.1 hypothetical protein A7J15_00405 [Microbacterium sediminis]QBR73957.1 hypothetical protein E3O41_05650 [Microbacterium sediminis]
MTSPKHLPLASAALIGVIAALAGLLPWVAAGLQLPLQNLWAAPTLPEDMPFALLPFSQYALPSLFGLLALPGAAVGLALRGRSAPRTRWAAAGGIVLVQAVAIVQTAIVTAGGMRQTGSPTFAADVRSISTAAALYVTAIVVFCAVAAVIGVVALHLAAGTAVPGAAAGLAAGAVAAGFWIRAWTDITGPFSLDPPAVLVWAWQWLPALLVGAILAWSGRRVGAWVGALAILWLAPALLWALLGAVASRVNLGSWGAMLETALITLQGQLVGGLWPVLVAAAIGLLGAVALAFARGARGRSDAPAAGETLEA